MPAKSSDFDVFADNAANSGFFPVLLPVPEAESAQIRAFLAHPPLSTGEQQNAYDLALRLAESARNDNSDGLVGQLIAAYNLTSDEGRALMELAESLLRVPDAASRDALISDKLGGRDWHATDTKGFARAAALALSAAGLISASPDRQTLFSAAAKKLGMPAIRACVGEAMKMMGGHFVFAETIQNAIANATKNEAANVNANANPPATEQTLYSFDMLGEAARCEEDAKRYYDSYLSAICAIGDSPRADSVSIKLSALYPRLETRQYRAINTHLFPRIAALVCEARRRAVPVSIDAEESARLELSLAIIRRLMALPELANWDGFGVVVQAYNRRAAAVIDTLIATARQHNRRLPIRLVKGAYWDAEIKIAQEKGLPDFPLFTRKAHSDIAFLHHAKTLLNSAWIYPQIATHNAATIAAVSRIAAQAGRADDFEFQRLHGMGAPLYRALKAEVPHRLRVYAPVGGHKNLLAYLVRRLLENGANASFIHQLSDPSVPTAAIVTDPATIARQQLDKPTNIRPGEQLFAPRQNSRGWDTDDATTLAALQISVTPFLVPAPPPPETTPAQIAAACQRLAAPAGVWAKTPASARADVLEKFAALLEANAPQLFGLLMLEGKKTISDCVAELREAVDFCRFYAAAARQFCGDERPRGLVLAISPWNFPLAIFCGQLTAALAAGNVVLAKPAEQTPQIAQAASDFLYQAGLPSSALQLIIGRGETVGAQAVKIAAADMIVFTGSTQTAKTIERSIADSPKPHAPLLAETGGLNAMLVDSTALIERATDDILRSAFQSAGQRCSALRMLYVQEDIKDALLPMLCGAAQLLVVGDARAFSSDISAVIDEAAKNNALRYIADAKKSGRLLWCGEVPSGCYVPPAIIQTTGIADLPGEVFAPVLHVASFPAGGEEKIINDINASGYGLTFGAHSRIAQKLDEIANRIGAGNVYINRDQIGAIVGSQPFGGRGLSGTGPKAGGFLYVRAFTENAAPPPNIIGEHYLPGPDGERNLYRISARGHILCLSQTAATAAQLSQTAIRAGNRTTTATDLPKTIEKIDAVMCDTAMDFGDLRRRLAVGSERVIPLIRTPGDEAWLFAEKHICTDMTASGGNIDLLARQ